MKRWSWLVVLLVVLVAGTVLAKENTVQKKAGDYSVDIKMDKDTHTWVGSGEKRPSVPGWRHDGMTQPTGKMVNPMVNPVAKIEAGRVGVSRTVLNHKLLLIWNLARFVWVSLDEAFPVGIA